MRIPLMLAAAAAAFLAAGRTALACGPMDVCADASSSFAGEIVLENIVLTWSTDAESTGVSGYVLKRYNCSNPSTCSTSVASIAREGSCGTLKEYEYTDSPPAPLSQWTYTLEVWKTDNTRACAIDAVPQ